MRKNTIMIEQLFLTVCIPTYNRSEYLHKQLLFIEKQIKHNPILLQHISFKVSDNASTDNTNEIISEFSKRFVFEDMRNSSNVGFVGNVFKLLNRCKTEYVWFLSDDDELEDGVFEEVLRIVNMNKSPEFIFLNYSSFNGMGFSGESGYRIDSKKAALEVYKEAYGSLVFISSCIYKRKHIIDLSGNSMLDFLTVPLLFSFYSCSCGPIYLSRRPWVNFTQNNASYYGFGRLLRLKFEEQIRILESLTNYHYDKKSINWIIRDFFVKQSHSFMLYSFINPKRSFYLLRYYSLYAFVCLPINIFSLLKTYIKLRVNLK